VLGDLHTVPARQRLDLLASAVAAMLPHVPEAEVAEIDAALADTVALCAALAYP